MTSMSEKPEVDLRPATASDSRFAFNVKKAALGAYIAETYGWDEAEQRRLHEERFRASRTQIIGWEGMDVGLLATDEIDDRIRLQQLFVLPHAQNQGIGSLVLARVLQSANVTGRPVCLQVLKSNPRARAFYERNGFALTGETETHYGLKRS